MKKAIFVSFALVLVLTTTYLLAQKSTPSIADRWKKVEAYAQKELPESALKEIDIILKQAQKEHRQDEVIKAMVCKMRFTLDKDPDKAPELIREFEAFTLHTTDPATRALLHSMTGELYAQYYNQHKWEVNQRTIIEGKQLSDIREWTQNMFYDKIVFNLNQSLKDKSILQKQNSKDYSLLITPGNQKDDLTPTLFDVLSYRKIEILSSLLDGRFGTKMFQASSSSIPDSVAVAVDSVAVDEPAVDSLAISIEDVIVDSATLDTTVVVDEPVEPLINRRLAGSSYNPAKKEFSPESLIKTAISQTYIDLIEFRKKQNIKAAALNAEVGYLKYNYNHPDDFTSNRDSIYLTELNRLEKAYAEHECVVEVLALKANFYLLKMYEYGNRPVSYDTELTDTLNQKHKFKRIAFDICERGIQKFPEYSRIALLQNLRTTILQRSIQVSTPNIVKPNDSLVSTINSQNVDTIKVSVYRIDDTSVLYHKYRNAQREYAPYPNRTLIKSDIIIPKKDYYFNEVQTKYKYRISDFGQYDVEFKANGSKDCAVSSFVTTNLMHIQHDKGKKGKELFVTDSETGRPLSSVRVSLYKQNNSYTGSTVDSVTTVVSDGDGYFAFDSLPENNYVAFLEKGNDKFYTISLNKYDYSWRDNQGEVESKSTVTLLTDRAVYRPGQTIYFKGIAYTLSSKKEQVIANKTFEVKLNNTNGETISTKKYTSNDFGSFKGEFILPENGLNGEYTLSVDGDDSKTIIVEEYKRPTIEVALTSPKSELFLGDSVHVQGNIKAMAGYSIPGAKITYSVVRNDHALCTEYFDEETVENGTLNSNEKGDFTISFLPKRMARVRDNKSVQCFTYTINVTATDLKGETQTAESSVSVGDQSLVLSSDLSRRLKKDTVSVKILLSTLNDEPVQKKISYKVYRLKKLTLCREDLEADTIPEIDKCVLSGTVESNSKLFLNLKHFQSGEYKLELNTTDSRNRSVTSNSVFILYSDKDKRPPMQVHLWLNRREYLCKSGEVAKINVGTSDKKAYLLYEIYAQDKVLSRSWMKLSNHCKTINIPFLSQYGDGVTVVFTTVRKGNIYSKSVTLLKAPVSRTLTPKLSTFRNKIQPGEKVTWTVNIPEVNKKRLTELALAMYDASLDNIARNSWLFQPYYIPEIGEPDEWEVENTNQAEYGYNYRGDVKDVVDIQLGQLNWFGLAISQQVSYFRSLAMVRNTSGADYDQKNKVKSSRINVTNMMFAGDGVGVEPPPALKSSVKFTPPVIKKDEEMFAVHEDEQSVSKINLKNITPRTNFNETAFFYPQLQTDSAGNVQFSFTAPESLTRWNVKMLAHTQDLYFGQAEAQVVTQKELMVQMNLPRFVRRSDKLTLSANVVNLSDKAQTADVAFQLIDPATNQPIVLKNAPTQQVTLAANETKVVSWEVSEFSPYELVICKVVASSEQFSDGEQKYLPVLPDKVLLTESMPLIIRGGQSRDFRFESLMKNAAKVETKNLAVEFSANPAWYAVQALPTISEPNDDNAISLFTAYYANTLAGWIANSSPKISAMFDRWKNEGGSREALLSNLQKNAELKNMLLEETPWVMAAQNETEQKRQIALLFDLNNQKNKTDQYWDKLQKLQLPSGGFAWFAGMPESRYTTLEILLNWARLQRMTKSALPGDDARLSSITHALEYLDLEIAHDFSDLKKYNKNYEKEDCLSDVELFYLHTRSEYSQIPLHESAKEAVKFYTAQAEKYWHDCTLYGKAMMAVTFSRNGNKKLAVDILNSLKENALKTDEMGMYWAKNSSGYFWNERPIAVQAAIINAFTELEPGSAAIDELKIWLLKQKQTQSWDNPLASVNAIYALLNNGSNWLSNESTTIVKVDGKELKPATKEAGTGYFKQTIPTANLTASQLADLSKVKVISTAGKNSSVGWGAMYWQFYQNQEEVEAQSGALKVSKSLYVLKSEGTTKEMIPANQTTLHKGDKVITRLVVTTDRNLEYVALKDLRAACFEPVNQLSGYQWKEGVGYYQTSKDASTQFFFSYLPKGTYVFEYELWVNNSGTFTSGITSLQCQYAPEFVSHSGGERIVVK